MVVSPPRKAQTVWQGPFEQDPFRRDPFDSQSDDGNTFEGEYERKDDDDRNKLN